MGTRSRRHAESSESYSLPVMEWLTIALACMLCVALVFFFSGCWDARDIDNTGFVMGMGVDESDDGRITVWVQMALPSSAPEAEGGFPSWLGSATGSTIMEAMSVLKAKSAKTLFRGHVRVLVIGETIARGDLRPILDFMARDSQFRYNSWVVVTSDPVSKVFEVEAEQQSMASAYINDMMRHATLSSIAPQSRFRDLMSTWEEPGDQPILARVGLVKAESPEEGGGQGQKQGSTEGQGVEEGDGQGKPAEDDLAIGGCAALHGDSMVGWLTPVETAMVLMARNKLKEYSFIHEVAGRDGGRVGVQVLHSRAELKLPPRGEMTGTSLPGAEVRIKVTGRVYIREVTSEEQFVALEATRDLNRGLSEQIEREMKSLIEAAQTRLGSDILGIGEAVRRQVAYETWERELAPRWHDLFKTLRIVPEVNLRVERQGTTMTSPRPRA